jgi:hypothetical protein
MSLIGASVSLLRGSQFYYDSPETGPHERTGIVPAPNGSSPRAPAHRGSPQPADTET